MKKISAMIVEDDITDLLITEYNLNTYCPEIKIEGKFLNSTQALDAAKKKLPNVAFIDINMGGVNGIELAKEFQLLKIQTVFISAHSQFALQALKISALDFLV